MVLFDKYVETLPRVGRHVTHRKLYIYVGTDLFYAFVVSAVSRQNVLLTDQQELHQLTGFVMLISFLSLSKARSA